MIKSILWDFDGVIAESVNVKTEAFRELYLPYGDDVAQKVVEHHLAHGGVSRFEKFKIYHEQYLKIPIDQKEVERLSAMFSEIVLNKVVSAPYIDGVIDFIHSTQSQYDHFVISGTPDGEMKEIINRRKIRNLFIEVMGSPKTKVEWINDLVSRGKISIDTSVFIGDATTDYNAAKTTGMNFVLREVYYNQDLFRNYEGIRVLDFTDFFSVIEAL